MTMKSKTVLLIFLFCFICTGITAKDADKETSAESDTLEYTLPEILVRGDNSMHSLKMEVIKAEELKFEVFNNLNSTDDFDITCEWRTLTGSRLKHWKCDVEYMRKARAESLSNWRMGGAPMPSDSQLAIRHADKTRALNKEMKALATRYPEMAIAMVNAHEMEQLYVYENQKRYKDSIFVGKQPEPDLVLNKLVIWEAAFTDHKNGAISDEIWKRWDSTYKKIFSIKSYRRMWKKANHKKYREDFVAYVNEIISK